MNASYKEVILAKGREQSLQRKHPWIFSGGIKFKAKDLEDGDLVHVYDAQKNCVGTGMYNDGSIMVRLLSFEQSLIDAVFWKDVLSRAVRYRKNILGFPSSNTNAYRLFHGEGDGVPGLVIDIYGKTAVVQCHNIGLHKMLTDIAAQLLEIMKEEILCVYSRSKDTLPSVYAQSIADGIVAGNGAEEDVIFENGYAFKVNWSEGQKTGFFLDQRENRSLVGRYASGRSVLNCFCYTGGFSVYAACNGASSVDSVDISGKAMQLTDQNMSLNKIINHHSHVANVMDFLTTNHEAYDIVIVDPPAFAKSISKRHNAVQAYKRLNILALKAVKPGGILFTFSCSQVVNTQLFYDTIVAAGMEAGRPVRVMQHLSQGPDHPVNLFHPEGHYLKGLMVYVE